MSEEAAREARDIRLWLACQVYYRLTGVLFYTTLSRTIESAAIGQYFYALSLMESGLVLANLALNPWLMRSVAQNIAAPLELLGGILRLRLLLLPVYLILAILLGRFLGQLPPTILLLSLASVYLDDLYSTLGAFFLALRRVRVNIAIGLAVQTGYTVAVLLLLHRHPSIQTQLLLLFLRALCLSTLAFLVILRTLGFPQLAWKGVPVRAAIPFASAQLLGMVRERLDTLMLATWLGLSAVGDYQLALRLIAPVMFVPSAIGLIQFPTLAEADVRMLRSALARGFARLLGLGVMGAIALFWLSPLIAQLLYGNGSDSISTWMQALTLLIPLWFTDAYLCTVLQATGGERLILGVQILSLPTLFLLGVPLLMRFGGVGLIAALGALEMLRVGVFLMAALRRLRGMSAGTSGA